MPNGNRFERKQKEKSRFRKSDVKTTLIYSVPYGTVKALFINNFIPQGRTVVTGVFYLRVMEGLNTEEREVGFCCA